MIENDKLNDFELKIALLAEEKRSKQKANEARNMKANKGGRKEVIDGEFQERIAIQEQFQREESLKELIYKQRVFRQMGFKVKVSKRRYGGNMGDIHYL